MSPEEFKKIRVRLDLTQEELAEILGVAGKNPVSRYELGERNPSSLMQAVMSILDSQSEKEALVFIELIRKHMKKILGAKKRKTNARA